MLTAEQRKEKMKAVIRAGTGNFLELYDFLVYAYFAPYIARAFFPTENEFMSIMLALGTYGVASFARPFGAIILGSYMDRHGRRKGLLVTLTLMADRNGDTRLHAGLTRPSGLLAPIIITAGRLIQGFSIGVEAGGVNVYLAEIATPKNRGFYCSWQGGSQALGVMAATGLGAFLTATLTPEEMQAYGWRIPLIVGCGIIPILFWLRRSLQETEYFENSTHARSTWEVLRILGENWVDPRHRRDADDPQHDDVLLREHLHADLWHPGVAARPVRHVPRCADGRHRQLCALAGRRNRLGSPRAASRHSWAYRFSCSRRLISGWRGWTRRRASSGF